VTYIATAQAGDQEMRRRIAQHRARRPFHWETIEAGSDIAGALAQATSQVVLLDCLTLLCSNSFLASAEQGELAALAAVARTIDTLLHAATRHDGDLIVVTNEVGFGIVPDTEYGRWFRDALGAANCRVAAAAENVVLVVSGRALRLEAS
jgi:adenosyl cobinamide kinase/adenosyl cobinamide phosphate guanylyltransferase